MNLQELCAKYEIRFKKTLGQNLLLDDNINRIMTDAADLSKEDSVIEVGAGLGALTTRLAPQVGQLLSIEIDRAFMPCLEDQFGELDNVRLFRGDVLNHEVEKLVEEYLPDGKTFKMISNLPYYITTPILFHFWESDVPFDRMVVMVQEEVGLRMASIPGQADYGALAIASQYHAEVDVVHRVPRTCFRPEPKVDSCIMRLRAHKTPPFPGVDGPFMLRVVRAAFAHRRKTLRNSLTKSSTFGAPKEAVLEAFEETGIDPSRRPQTLSLDEFAGLSSAIRSRM
jgi:16S rRNA (adenine1518-N6/adenine1519-N6)-dimethyltransferase